MRFYFTSGNPGFTAGTVQDGPLAILWDAARHPSPWLGLAW